MTIIKYFSLIKLARIGFTLLYSGLRDLEENWHPIYPGGNATAIVFQGNPGKALMSYSVA